MSQADFFHQFATNEDHSWVNPNDQLSHCSQQHLQHQYQQPQHSAHFQNPLSAHSTPAQQVQVPTPFSGSVP